MNTTKKEKKEIYSISYIIGSLRENIITREDKCLHVIILFTVMKEEKTKY